jgi:hypothetical protein
MPTGYTADLYDGKEVSLRDFILRCSRAMGAAVLLRDSDMDVVPTPENVSGGGGYAERRLVEAKQELERWKNLKGPELLASTEAFNLKQRESREKAEAETVMRREAYEGMIVQVEAWEPPTPDHVGFKDFMLEQLRNSLEFDCHAIDGRWYQEYLPGDLRDMKIGNLTTEIERLEHDVVEEREREEGRRAWVQALYDSLPEEVRA